MAEIKKRVLFINEASPLNTGFSKIGKEILSRLYKNRPDLTIAECGCYLSPEDPRIHTIPWTFYPVMPRKGDERAAEAYNSSVFGQFGASVLEQTLLDFKATHLISITDQWMSSAYQLLSPFRPYFKYLLMPTIDGSPQKIEWMDDYSRVDVLMTYSRFGKETLEKESPKKLNVFAVVRPGVNPDLFHPIDKKEIRARLGIPQEWNIIVSTMRNQRRKLFPDLFEAFVEYLAICVKNNRRDLAENSYLYCHTSLPDVGFDLGSHLMRNNIGHKVLFTYYCEACKKYHVAKFQTEIAYCPYCHKLSAHMPNTQSGVSDAQLCEIYNLADLYIQYSISEGLACPIAEAKACSVPAMAVDYSAMSEQVAITGCQKIRVEKFFWETVLETEQARALPDNADFAKKVFRFFCAPKDTRIAWGEIARKDAVENYSFDRAAKIFERAIDSTEALDPQTTWFNPTPRYAPANKNIPGNFKNNAEFLNWCIINILGRPDLIDSYWKNELLCGLNTGAINNKIYGNIRCEPKWVIDMMMNRAMKQNAWENTRISHLVKPKETKKQLTFGTF